MAEDSDKATERVASGVEALIERLRDEGVASGKSRADKLVAAAQEKAREIIANAEAEAKKRVEAAQKEADALRVGGEEALKVAARDMTLSTRAQLEKRFTEDVKRLVARDTESEELIKQMILEVVGQARDRGTIGEDDEVEVLLPRDAVGLEDLRRDPSTLRKGKLTEITLDLAGAMLRDGVSFGVMDDAGGGIRIHSTEKGIEMDLTDRAIADVLLQHLQPRFRAILEGIVK